MRPAPDRLPLVVIADVAACHNIDSQCMKEVAPELDNLRESGALVILFGSPWGTGIQYVR